MKNIQNRIKWNEIVKMKVNIIRLNKEIRNQIKNKWILHNTIGKELEL